MNVDAPNELADLLESCADDREQEADDALERTPEAYEPFMSDAQLLRAHAAQLRSTTQQPVPELHEARKALNCLYIAVEEEVARDVVRKVEAAFAALQRAPIQAEKTATHSATSTTI